MTNQIKWSNEPGSRGRSSWLIFVRGDEVIPFAGGDIAGVVVVRGTDYTKNGKWSHTTFRLEVAPGIRHISGRTGWGTGTFAEGLGSAVGKPTPDTWPDMAACLGVSVPAAMEFLRAWRLGAAKALDDVEQKLASLEEAAESPAVDTVTVTVSFGSPRNRDIAAGWWDAPKCIPGFAAEIRKKDAGRGWGADNIDIVGIAGTVISSRHSDGMHGGYYAVQVAVLPGTETEIPPFVSAQEKAARASGVPEALFHAFGGNVERVREFLAKVAALDVSTLDEHEMSCGRARKHAEVVRVSGDPNFFLGGDPNVLCAFIPAPPTEWTTEPACPAPAKNEPVPEPARATPVKDGGEKASDDALAALRERFRK